MAKNLFIDVETYSSVDIKESGAYKYIESPDFEILIIGYALDNGPVNIVDLAQGDDIPEEFDGMPVRVWNWDEPFFEDGRTLIGDNLYRYRGFGATDIITNVPENYLM